MNESNVHKEVKRVLDKMVEMNWIIVNESINQEVLPSLFIEVFKEVKLKDFISLFRL